MEDLQYFFAAVNQEIDVLQFLVANDCHSFIRAIGNCVAVFQRLRELNPLFD